MLIIIHSICREHDAGILTVGYELGSELQESLIIPPNVDDIVVAGHCGSFCTRQKLKHQPINVFNVLMHSHKSGRKLKLRHFRDGSELPNILRDDHFDFEFQQNKVLAQEVQVYTCRRIHEFPRTKQGKLVGKYNR